jgi:hypothetical protein
MAAVCEDEAKAINEMSFSNNRDENAANVVNEM